MGSEVEWFFVGDRHEGEHPGEDEKEGQRGGK